MTIYADYEYKDIYGKGYQKRKDGSFWYPKDNNGTIICQCNSDFFLVKYTDTYTTEAQCVECDCQEVIHSG